MSNFKNILPAASSGILKASRIGDLNKVRSLVNENPDLVFIKEKQSTVSMGSFLISSWNVTPLHYAAWKGHKDIVEFLLANKAEANAKDSRGYTPLHYAAATGNADVVGVLLSYKADVKAPTSDGLTPISIAMSKNRQDAAQLIQQQINLDSRDAFVQTQSTVTEQPQYTPATPTISCEKNSCLCCGQFVSAKRMRLLCVNEVPELTPAKGQNTTTTWRVTDKKEWHLLICPQCISSKYGGRLNAESSETKKHLKTSVFCLVGSIAFFPIASLGIFRGMGGITNLLALFWAGCLLFGLFGTPAYFYALMKKKRGLANFRRSGMVSESEGEQLFIKEAEQILKSLTSDLPAPENVVRDRYPLPTTVETHAANRRRITIPT
jgi:hypothetical protein